VEDGIRYGRMFGLVWLEYEQKAFLICRDERSKPSNLLQRIVLVDVGKLKCSYE
jgi:hypothetical protein